jgi:hypothetical protein
MTTDMFRLSLDSTGAFTAAANIWFVVAILISAIVIGFIFPHISFFKQQYEIDEIELGIGAGRITISPNQEDLQIAYRLWVELKTRKLGLPFDEEHDVIIEVYNSWHEFFKITRELIKAVPVVKVRGHKSTQIIVGISIDVLNKAVRPHLTKWQARFRHWYEIELSKSTNTDVPPQELQKRYPQYAALVAELKGTNARLVTYASMLTKLLEVNPVQRNSIRKKAQNGTND